MSPASLPARRGVVQCALAAVLFGAATPASAQLGTRLPAVTLAGLLYLGAALAMLPLVSRNRPDRRAARSSAPRLAVAIVAGGMAGPVLLLVALAHAPASTVALLLNLEVVFTAILARAFFGEQLGPRVVAGVVAVGAAGVTLGWSNQMALRNGAIFAALACACWAIDNTVTANLHTFTPAQITLAKGAVAGSVNLVLGLALSRRFDPVAAGAALLLGAVGYGASIMLWISGARELGAARGQVIFASAPFVGAVLSWTLLGEPVQGRALLAAALAAAGVALVIRSSHGHTHRHEPLVHQHDHEHDDQHHAHHQDQVSARHTHRHRHEPVSHRHPHLPDLHHRHRH